jgi:hypothetical protein
MPSKVFYKKILVPDEEGLMVVTRKFVSIHETPCFYFCVPESSLWLIRLLPIKDESGLQYARRTKILRRISKSGSRIAFDNEEEALNHLIFLKEKHLYHVKRDVAFIEKFLMGEKLDKYGEYSVVPNSKELVHKYLSFD